MLGAVGDSRAGQSSSLTTAEWADDWRGAGDSTEATLITAIVTASTKRKSANRRLAHLHHREVKIRFSTRYAQSCRSNSAKRTLNEGGAARSGVSFVLGACQCRAARWAGSDWSLKRPVRRCRGSLESWGGRFSPVCRDRGLVPFGVGPFAALFRGRASPCGRGSGGVRPVVGLCGRGTQGL